MRRGIWLALLLCITQSGMLSAAEGDQYILPKFGAMEIDLLNADSLISYGLMYGYGLSDTFSFEAEYNAGVSGGDYSAAGQEGRYEIYTVAGYAVHRYSMSKRSFLKTKLGLLSENVDVISKSPGSSTENSKTDEGVAGGIGAGYSFSGFTIEIEATVIDKDIIFYSLGTHYQF